MNRTFADSYCFYDAGNCVGAVGPAKTIRFQPFFFCAWNAPRRAQIIDVMIFERLSIGAPDKDMGDTFGGSALEPISET
jgi:hypothetical protein